MTHTQFQEAVALIARSLGKSCSATCIDALQIYHPEVNAPPLWTYSAYIEDYGYTVACPSPDAALAKLQDKIDGKVVQVQP